MGICSGTRQAFPILVILLFSVSWAAYPSGLVSYWPFDSNANDALGMNNGTVVGATLAASGGRVGGTYVFSGSNNYILVPSSLSLNFGPGNFSILAWAKAGNNTNRSTIIQKFFNPANAEYYGWYIDVLGSSGLVRAGANSGYAIWNLADSPSSVNNNAWHLLALVWNGTGTQIAVDGAFVTPFATFKSGNVTFTNTTNDLLIGKGWTGFDSPSVGMVDFNGSIDEVAIFNRTLSASEIAQFYNNSKDGARNYFGACVSSCPSFGTGTPANGSTLASTSVFANITLNPPLSLANFTFNWNSTNYSFYDSSLVGMWSFEDMNYSDNFDSGINSAHWNNNNGVTANAGKARYSIPSGSSSTARALNSYGTMSFSGSFDMQVDFTEVSTSDVTESDYALRLYNYANASNYYEIKKNILAGTDYYQMYCSGTQVSNNATSLTSGKFRLVSSGSTISSYYYDSGAWKQSGSCSISPTASYYLWLGAWNWGSYPALTVDFDNFQVNSGQSISDSSKYGNNGTLSSAYSSQPGKYGNGIQLSSGYSDMGDVSVLDGSSQATVSVWAKPNTNSQNVFVSKWDNANNMGLLLYMPANSGVVRWAFANGVWSPLEVAGLALNDGQWHHLAAVANGTHLRLFLDGSAIGTPKAETSSMPNIASNLQIGYASGVYSYNGTIDEVRIYNRSLSAAEVKQLYLSNLRKLNSTAWEFVTNQTNLTDGTYAYAAYSTDTSGYTDSTGLRSVTLAYNPVVSTYSGETTNFAAVADITNVTNLTLEKAGAGKIKFPSTHSVNAAGADYDTQVIIGNGFISVNSSALDSSFNSTAMLTMNLTGVYSSATAPTIYYYEAFASSLATILQNGQVCSAPRCTGVSWNQGTGILTFNVTGFSDYGVNGSGNFTGAGGSPTNTSGTIGINITSTNQIAVYTSSSSNNSAFSFIPVTPPAAGSIVLTSNESGNVTGGDTGFLVENQGNVNVSITVASDKNAAGFIGGSAPLFRMFGSESEAGSCPGINQSMQDLGTASITVCPSLAFNDASDRIWAYVLVKIDSDSPPQTSTATLTFTSTQA
ncbi:MAG: LamG domain-containing protein [Candidatus Micrarchaeia archaeon]